MVWESFVPKWLPQAGGGRKHVLGCAGACKRHLDTRFDRNRILALFAKNGQISLLAGPGALKLQWFGNLLCPSGCPRPGGGENMYWGVRVLAKGTWTPVLTEIGFWPILGLRSLKLPLCARAPRGWLCLVSLWCGQHASPPGDAVQ